MPSCKDGQAGTLTAPTAPTEADDACDATAGQVESASANSRESQTGRTGSVDTSEESTPSDTPAADDSPAPASAPKDSVATIQAKWSKVEITVDHNSSWPPATPPTDVVPEEAKVDLIVETTNVPDGTSASITVYSAALGSAVHSFSNLQVSGNKVVSKDSGNAPQWAALDSSYWEPWDHPFFYFVATVDYQGLTAKTPVPESQALRLDYWHVCVSDAIADSPAGGGLSTGAEMSEIAGFLQGVAHHKVLQQAVNQRQVPVALWGSLLRNTFCYHHASHGDIVDRTTSAQLNDGNNNPPTVSVGNWRSVIVLGSTNLGDAEISQADKVPTSPRYLAYLDTCVAGWESSFANAFTSSGTQNVIAFRCYIPDGDARTMPRNFYRKWCNTHQCNPSKIPDLFFDVGAPYYSSMRPILYGQGAGEIASPFMQIVNAIGSAIVGAVSAIADLF